MPDSPEPDQRSWAEIIEEQKREVQRIKEENKRIQREKKKKKSKVADVPTTGNRRRFIVT